MGIAKKSTRTILHHEREIFGVLITPEKEGKYPVVVFSHGYNGSGKDFESMGEYLATKGIASFCYDFCGGSVHSRSGMKTTDMTIFTEKEDLHGVIKYLQTCENIEADNLFVFGASQGGLVSALVTDEICDEVRGLMLLFPALCIADNWNERFINVEDIPDVEEFWGMTLGRKFFEELRDFDVFEHIGQYSGKVIIMHGDKDPIVSLYYSQKLKEVYSDMKLEVFLGEGHGFSEEGNKRVTDMVLDFVLSNKK
jgi:cephalosporin-C deacetylase-like acetyl esterase